MTIRLTGGLGDHVLGMRVLPFIHARYPGRPIVVYSDSAGHETPAAVAGMSPYVSHVVSVFRRPGFKPFTEQGLEALRHDDLAAMLSAELFLDGAGSLMFTNAASALDVPIVDIVARRTELVVSEAADKEASLLLSAFGQASFVGVNVSKFGNRLALGPGSAISRLLEHILSVPDVLVLKIYTSEYDYPHLNPALRERRRDIAREDAKRAHELCCSSDRVIPCVDLPLSTVVALLRRCRYFVGVDNGIKHLAWALDIPLTFFCPFKPAMYHIIRWMPDYHRLLPFECSEPQLRVHMASATRAILATT